MNEGEIDDELQETQTEVPIKKARKTKKVDVAEAGRERFAKNLRAARMEKNMTHQHLAELIDMSVAYISLLERAQRTVPLDTLEYIAEALGTTSARLLS